MCTTMNRGETCTILNVMPKIDPKWSATVSGDCYYVQFNAAGASHRTSTMELLKWAGEMARAVQAGQGTAEEYLTLRHRPEPENQYDRNAIAIDLRWPGDKKFLGGRKPSTYRHCGYVPAQLAEVVHSSGLLSELDQILLLLDHIWHGDDNPEVFRISVNLLVGNGDVWKYLHTGLSEAAAWSSVWGVGLLSPNEDHTFEVTRGEQPRNPYLTADW